MAVGPWVGVGKLTIFNCLGLVYFNKCRIFLKESGDGAYLFFKVLELGSVGKRVSFWTKFPSLNFLGPLVCPTYVIPRDYLHGLGHVVILPPPFVRGSNRGSSRSLLLEPDHRLL